MPPLVSEPDYAGQSVSSRSSSSLLGAGCLDQRLRHVLKQGDCLLASQHLRADESAVDEHGELSAELFRLPCTQAPGKDRQAAAHFRLVFARDFACRMIGFRKLRGDIDLRAAAVVGSADTFTDPGKMRIQFGGRVRSVFLRDRFPGAPEVLVLANQEGGDEIVLGADTLQTCT